MAQTEKGFSAQTTVPFLVNITYILGYHDWTIALDKPTYLPIAGSAMNLNAVPGGNYWTGTRSTGESPVSVTCWSNCDSQYLKGEFICDDPTGRPIAYMFDVFLSPSE
jgi:hypothetical protein